MNRMQKAIISKDIRVVTKDKMVLMPIIILPALFCIIFPLLLFIIPFNQIHGMETLYAAVPKAWRTLSKSEIIIRLSIDQMFSAYLLLIPLMCSSVLGASSFVGEREHKTMETILYTPISIEDIFKAKMLGVFIPSYIISLGSYLLFWIIISAGSMIRFGISILPDLRWIILMLWLVPSVTLLGLAFTVDVSARSKTFQEAQQFGGFLVIPFIAILIVQLKGIVLLNTLYVIAAGAVIFIADYLLIKKMSKTFKPEKLV